MSRASRHRILAAMLSACLLSLLGGCTPLTVLAVLGGCKDGGSNGSSGGVTGSVTTGEVRDGMTIAQTKAWFNGSDGPDNVCQAYPDGQCTWWACMRGHKIGLDVGSYWGNGGDWAASATAAGWELVKLFVFGVCFINKVPFVRGMRPRVGRGPVSSWSSCAPR